MVARTFKMSAVIMLTMLVVGCASHQVTPLDYSAYKQSRPRSVVILPPLNESPDVNATYSMLSQMTRPLAESGYYVFPVTLVDETFKQNGLTEAHDIHAVAPAKLREIFGADAALWCGGLQLMGYCVAALLEVGCVHEQDTYRNRS